MNKLSTGPLEQEQLIQAVHDFIQLLQKKKISKVKVMFGFNSNKKDLYEEIELDIDSLNAFFNESVSKGIIQVGFSDFFIKNNEFEFLLGNDKDLVFTSEEESLMNEVKSMWIVRGYKIYEKL